MNFHQLQYVIAVDKQRNFARAAEECDIAQSTLSREIQRLEQELDVMIFDRTRVPVVPTMKGEDLIKQARKILEAQEKFISIAKEKNNLPAGEFRLGILAGLAPYLLPLFSQPLTEKYPELKLKVYELGPSEIIEHFEDDELDGAISIAPFPKEGFYEVALFEEAFVLYTGLNHPLASKSRVQWKDLQLDELLLTEEMKTHFLENRQGLLKGNPPGSKPSSIRIQNGSFETIRKIIDLNGGLTLLPQLACLYMGDRRLEMVRPIEAPILSRTIQFVAPRGFHKNRLSKVIQKEIVRSIPQEMNIKLDTAKD